MTDNVTISRRFLFWVSVIVLILAFTYCIHSILLPFVLGIFAAYFLDPAADRLEKAKFSRNMSTVIIMVLFFFGIIVLTLLIVPVIVEQLSGLLIAMPEYIAEYDQKYGAEVSNWLAGLGIAHAPNLKSMAADTSAVLLKYSGEFITGVLQSGMAVVNLFSLILITPVVTFYMLRDWDHMTARMDNLLPRQHADTIRQQLTIIDRTLAGFLRGQLNVCLMLGAYYALGLTLAGLKFGAVIGLMTGFFVIFPYVGFLFGFVIGMAVAFFQFSTYQDMGIVLAVFMGGQMLEGSFLTPKLVGEKVGLHPVWIIFGLLSGAALFGFVGVLLAVPATAVIGVLSRFAVQQYLNSTYYQGEKKRAPKH